MKQPTQFQIDFAKIMFSLTYRPQNWRCHFPYDLENFVEEMKVWVANNYYGIYFNVGHHKYGGTNYASLFFGWAIPWRVRLYKRAWKTIHSKSVVKYGTAWEAAMHLEETRKEMEILNEAFRAGQLARTRATSTQQHQFGSNLYLLYVQAKKYFSIQRFIRHRNHWTHWWFE